MLLDCPLPGSTVNPVIQLAHGGGGRMMQELLDLIILPSLGEDSFRGQQHDAAVLELNGQKLAFTTDSYVVSPIFFPGGDIGSLAVHGTINDLAMVGAKPIALSCALILEEGFPIADLKLILSSMRKAADASYVTIVTGDTKVVDHGKGDGIYINTAGIGTFSSDLSIHPNQIIEEDAIVLSGDIGRHGLAVLTARAGFDFESRIVSDSAPVWEEVERLLEAGIKPHCLRDLTRGGLCSVLLELAKAASCGMELYAENIRVGEDVQAICEILGLDPLELANEGRFVAFVAAQDLSKTLEILPNARLIGKVNSERRGRVSLRNCYGSSRLLSLSYGEPLPRIC